MTAWTPGIGDPTILDWVIVLAYIVATIRTGIAARRAWLSCRGRDAGPQSRREVYFWLFLALTLAFLGANKQLDLQSLLTEVARRHARAAGWYEARRIVQWAFVSALAVIGTLASLGLASYLRHAATSVRLAAVGAVALGIFVSVRAAFFHHVIVAGGAASHGSGLAHSLELGAVLLIAIAAQHFSRARV